MDEGPNRSFSIATDLRLAKYRFGFGVYYFGLPRALHHLPTFKHSVEFEASVLIHGRERAKTKVAIPYTRGSLLYVRER